MIRLRIRAANFVGGNCEAAQREKRWPREAAESTADDARARKVLLVRNRMRRNR